MCTGSAEHEGFPNFLLEVAAAGAPSVSLENFDSCLSNSVRIGSQGGLDEATPQIERLWNDRAACEAQAARAHEYVLREHNVAATIEALECLFDDLGLTSQAPGVSASGRCR